MCFWCKPTTPVEEAIDLVNRNIGHISRANNKDEVLRWEPGKMAKIKVDPKSNQSLLGQLVEAYQKHAELLGTKGCDKLAKKSSKKAVKIRSHLRNQSVESIVKANSVAPEATIHSATAQVNTPTNVVVNRSPFSSQSSISGMTPDAYFTKDIHPFAINMPPFPSPDCHLQDTRQLAVCLTLLLSKELSEDKRNKEKTEWIQITRSNKSEIERLNKIANDVVRAFIKADIKDSNAFAEVVPLAYNLEKSLHRHLLNSVLDSIEGSALLNVDSLDGLAHLVQSADIDTIQSGDLVAILRVLTNRLSRARPEDVNQLYPLVFAISRVLDAMVSANVGDIDRVEIHDPLTSLLDMSKSNKDLYLSYQVEYATQALLNVSNDEKPWHAGFRRLWLAISVGASFAKVPDPTEIKTMLEGLEKLYNEGKRDYRALRKAINGKGDVKLTLKDGFQFKSIWYRALRTAELYIQTGRLTYFEEFITNTQCRNDRMFQLGVCQLLGQFAADERWELKARQNAVAFIEALYRNKSSWILHDDAKQVIFDVLINLECVHGTDFEGTLTLISILFSI
ncbi:hypothetical protein FBU30_001502 [Linnemannia zychae]|nr:hypothetical protein FBU30_001502 [Linnemannia zychae]